MWAEYMHAGEAAAPRPASARARRFHRVVAMVFTATVAANFATMPFGPPPAWITFAPVLPLLVLMVTGLFMLVGGRRRYSGKGR